MDLKVVYRFAGRYGVRSMPLINIQSCTSRATSPRSSEGTIIVRGSPHPESPDESPVAYQGAEMKNFHSFAQAILQQKAIVQNKVIPGIPSNASTSQETDVCVIADAESVLDPSPIPNVQAATIPPLGDVFLLDEESDCRNGCVSGEGGFIPTKENLSMTVFHGFHSRVPNGIGTHRDLPDAVRLKAALDGAKVLFWTTFDPLLEDRLSASYFFWNDLVAPGVVLPCCLPLLLLFSPCRWMSARSRAREARRTFWILCEREIKIVIIGDKVVSIPLDCICECNLIRDAFMSVARPKSDGTRGIDRVSTAGMNQYKWFVQAILNQITISKGQAKQLESSSAVPFAIAATDISHFSSLANVPPAAKTASMGASQ
jgi:hypothetical protein